jgi:alcohol dehydrogenase class IV
VHSLSHPLGGLKNLKLHHGTLNAILLPAVLNFNRSHVGDKYQRMAQVMKLDADSDVADAIAELNRQLGLPPGLDALGVEETVLPGIARQALQDHCHATNPRTASEQDYLNILQTAMN